MGQAKDLDLDMLDARCMARTIALKGFSND